MSDPRLPRREFIATGVGLAAAALTSTRVSAAARPNEPGRKMRYDSTARRIVEA